MLCMHKFLLKLLQWLVSLPTIADTTQLSHEQYMAMFTMRDMDTLLYILAGFFAPACFEERSQPHQTGCHEKHCFLQQKLGTCIHHVSNSYICGVLADMPSVLPTTLKFFKGVTAYMSSLRGLVRVFQLELNNGSDICLQQAAYHAVRFAHTSPQTPTLQGFCSNHIHMTSSTSMNLLDSVSC